MTHELERIGSIDGVSAELYGHLFENPKAGLPRGVYANLLVKCKPISYQGRTWEPAVLIDFLRLSSLSNTVLTSETEPQAEGSFYMEWHDPLEHWQLDFEIGGDHWPVHANYQLSIDYSGYDGDACPALKISGSTPVKFAEIIVPRNNVFPKPCSHDDARAMLLPHFPGIAAWREIHEQDEDGFPLAQPGGYRFVRAD